jgi:hypothetical protein
MKKINIKRLIHSEVKGNKIIILGSIILIYLLISLYFNHHFFFKTIINEVNVSLKAHDDTDHIMISYINDYKLLLIERNGETEQITAQDIGMKYNDINSLPNIHHVQKSFQWITSLFKPHKYYIKDLFVYNKEALTNKVNQLNCLNNPMIAPRNVNFKYLRGSYVMKEEVYGNTVRKERLNEVIKMCILKGKTKLDLNENLCYENPKYTMNSDKALKTLNLLNKYVSTNITYKFGSHIEILDGNIINEWLSVDENLEVVINNTAIIKFVKELSRKYDTVGVTRSFKTSTSKIVEVKGGLYGWKINQDAEAKAILENIKIGRLSKKEPIYTQKALSRDKDEIGNTYVEINITKQHLWFYKDGKLIAQGSIVTGNPSRGFSTVVGTYMLNYKQKDAILKGPGYEVVVNYWMPFYGNMGIHDAKWRYSFGGEIYKRRGTHGCVNAPLYLAKIIFENIEEGIPIISYEE